MASWCYNQDFKEEEQASGSNEKKMILAVEDDKVTLSEDSGEKALTPEDLINKVLMADEGADKVTVDPRWMTSTSPMPRRARHSNSLSLSG